MKITFNNRTQTLFLCLVFAAKSYAQFARFRHLTVEDGLTQNSITCLVQDKKGFIWIGTYNGLNKYDGYKIVSYKASPSDTNSIAHNSIRCLYSDNDNNLWAGTIGGGMFRIDLITGKISNFRFDSLNVNCLSNDYVNSIKEFETGKLYISTNDGLNIFDKKTETFTVFRKMGKNNLPFLSDNIKQMVKDKRGHIWFSHSNAGITEYNPANGKCNYYSQNTEANKLNSNNVKTIFCDSKGLIWISCWNFGANIIDTKTGKTYSSKDTIHKYKGLRDASLVSQFYEDEKGNIWMATAEHGIVCLDAKTYETVFYENNKNDEETISDNTVFTIIQDRSGLFWAGTWKGGVNVFNPRSLNFGYYKHSSNTSNTLSDNNVTAFAEKSESEMYIGHGAAADIFNRRNNTFRKFPINEKDDNSLRSNSSVLYIYPDKKDSSLWFSTSGGFPYRYFCKSGKYRNYVFTGDSTSFGHHTSYTILRDNNEKLWIASTTEGLFLYNDDNDKFTSYKSQKNNSETILSNFINTILKNREGKFWVGTKDGLSLFDPVTKKAKSFLKDKNGNKLFSEAGVYSLFIDKEGNLWVGTGSGLYLFNSKMLTEEKFNEIHPAFSNIIYGILEDKNGNLWISTDNGLIMFNYKNKSYRYFSTEDGLQGREFAVNSCYSTLDGTLFFGGLNGFNAFNPNKLEFNSKAPEVSFTGFSVLNKFYKLPLNINYVNELHLSYRDYFFSFEFSALDYTNITENKYEYKLDGFNDNWVNTGNANSVTFTNLDPGTYTLKVRACNNDEVWCKEPAEILIVISPPFWKTGWFYFLCVVSGVIGVYLYIRWREKKLIREKNILENKVESRTVELKQEKQKLEEAHKEIKDSINYAKRIQEAILPLKQNIDNYLKNYFILYKPKDIVAGDFYWFHALPEENAVLIAAVDCTGHGVPGAFMSMIGNEQLTKIIIEKKITQPGLILDELHKGIRSALKQDMAQGETRDGMDIALCKIFLKQNKAEFAGAMRPFWLFRNGNLLEVKADKQPIGGMDADYRIPFTNNKIILQKNDTIYLFTDGYSDQFGGERGKKFMLKNFEKLLFEIDGLSMLEKQYELNNRIETWKGNHEQVDDILIIGVKL